MANLEQPLPSSPRIYSLGSINADFQMRTPRRPEVSETLVSSEFRRFAGGKAANVAYISRKLGAEALLLGHVGDDDLAHQALAPFLGSGMDLSGVKRVPNQDTGVAMITVPPDGKKGIVMAANANAVWTQEEVDQLVPIMGSAPAGSILVVDCEIPVFVVEAVMQAARQRGMQIILDPSPADQVSDAMLALADIVVPNSGEARSLTGIECRDANTAIQAIQQLQQRGAAIPCIKLPDGGCVLPEAGQFVHISAVPVDVVDTTGAGDAFAGAMAVALLEQRSLLDAACFAVAASHFAITGYGSQPAYPSRDQVNQLVTQLTLDRHAR